MVNAIWNPWDIPKLNPNLNPYLKPFKSQLQRARDVPRMYLYLQIHDLSDWLLVFRSHKALFP